jgi:DNA-binding beta-propeller fold protein YncE
MMKTRTRVLAACLFAAGLVALLAWAVAAQGEEDPADSASAAVSLGQPGLSFGYEATFGVTGEPYFSDTQHLNRPNGLFIDSADNVYIVEEFGQRMIKYNSSGASTLVIGEAGIMIATDNTFNDPLDVVVDGDDSIWVVDKNRAVQFDSSGTYQQQIGEGAPGTDDAHFDGPRGLAMDGKGRLYVADGNNHRVQVYTFTAGGSAVLSSTIGELGVEGSDNAHFSYPAQMVVDSSERLYVVDAGNDRVQRCTYAAGWTCATVHGGTHGSGSNELSWPYGLGIDDSDNVYIADGGNNRIKKLDTTTGISTTFKSGFEWPTDVAVDSGGNVYVADWHHDLCVVEKLDSGGTSLGVFAGDVGDPYETDDVHFNAPYGVAVDASGNIHVSTDRGYRVIKLSSTGVVQWVSGSGGKDERWGSYTGGPRSVAVDSSGTVYVVDTGNHKMEILNSNGSYADELGGTRGSGTYEFDNPQGIAVDQAGMYIYVADAWNHRVQIFDGNLDYVATLGVTGTTGTDNAHFDTPKGVTVDSSGNIYVADTGNHRVQIFDSSFTYSTTLGMTGVEGDDFAHFRYPNDVAVDGQGRVSVADTHNHRVQVFGSSGAYLTTIAGQWGTNTGEMREPMGVDVDGEGNLYVADSQGHRIQKFAQGASGWSQININGFGKPTNVIGPLEQYDGYAYAGTWNDDGPEVWRTSDRSTWELVAQSTTSATAIHDLQAFGTDLYWSMENEGQGAEIWRWDGTTATQVVSGGFDNTNNYVVEALVEFSDVLYAVAHNRTDSEVEIWRSATGDSGSWSKFATLDDAGSGLSADVYAGALLVGMQRGGKATMWASDGVTWSYAFTDGLRSANNTHVAAMAEFEGYLYIGVRNAAMGGEVWRTDDGVSWSRVISGGLGNASNARPYGLIVYGNQLYVVFSNFATGSEVWRTANGTLWHRIGHIGWGDSCNIIADYFNKGAVVFDGKLLIGTGNWAHGGEVWQLDWVDVYVPLVLRDA